MLSVCPLSSLDIENGNSYRLTPSIPADSETFFFFFYLLNIRDNDSNDNSHHYYTSTTTNDTDKGDYSDNGNYEDDDRLIKASYFYHREIRIIATAFSLLPS